MIKSKGILPKNALLAYEGRLIELMHLYYKLKYLARKDTWRALFNTKKYQKQKALRDKVYKHIKWLFDKKYPDQPKIYWEPYHGGFIFFSAAQYDKHHKKGK